MPNNFAYFMLFIWPIAALILFRSLPLPKALIWTILGGYLLLPSGTSIDLPLLPALDRNTSATFSGLLFCLIYAPRPAKADKSTGNSKGANLSTRLSGRWLVLGLLSLLIFGPILTVMQNTEPMITGVLVIKGLGVYDCLSMISSLLVSVTPFYLGWRYLNTRASHKMVLEAFVFGAIAYSLPVLFELRMSPQLHTWIYGFFPHDFVQHIRAGGFRPVVFLSHGLLIGVFFCMSSLAALALWREAVRTGKPASGWLVAAVWLTMILIFSKNLGALSIALALGLAVGLAGRRTQLIVAVAVAAVVLLYPTLRGTGWIPVDKIYQFALTVDEERAASLQFRFGNEDALLAHANQKPLSGWGSWGRNQLYDPLTGRETSVSDGAWVILIGVYGWLGYIAHFGLLTLPLLLFAIRRQQFGPSLIGPGMVVVLSATLIDLLPNASLVPYVWMLAGALTGLVLQRVEDKTGEAVKDTIAPARGSWGRTGGDRNPAAPWAISTADPRQRPDGRVPGRRPREQK